MSADHMITTPNILVVLKYHIQDCGLFVFHLAPSEEKGPYEQGCHLSTLNSCVIR